MGVLPGFNDKGKLPAGLHQCTGDEFIKHFCENDEVRRGFEKAIVDIFDFAKSRNAVCVFVGGCFVTNVPEPSDFDAVIVFSQKDSITNKGERLLVAGKKIDVMFCSVDEEKIVSAFLQLFAVGVYGDVRGIVQVNLNGHSGEWQIRHMPTNGELEIVKRAYINRELIDLDEPEGVLVTVHGLMSEGQWNSHVMPAFSSQGWTVAPFYYGYQSPNLLFDKGARKDVLNRFRDWLYELDEAYLGDISILAHSFGTYLVGAYLDGFEDYCPVNIQSVILTGSILSTEYDWDNCIGKIGRVRNEIAPNDQWVKWLPQGKWLALDPLFGKSGVKGFNNSSRILSQPTSKIFDHNNVIKRDVINQVWLPYLQANKLTLQRENYL